ncbi:type II secretion system protein GspK [Planctomycetes bacterium K23_9]|uniref:General secretion pathway protein K n=1 Tax=Stieleria marina TaxID=1930275 RepID=A0A517NQF2_9BACT|nr:General secretion pathway protein K [Planctomycetes bacterium K23_9]
MIHKVSKRRGFFLVLVLIVIVIATMAVQSFTGLMVAFDKSAYLSGDLVQARVAAESGSEVIRLILADPPEARVDSGGVFNNANLFQAVPVSMGIDGATPCNFSVVAPSLNEYGQLAGLRFGLQNESARLNVNALPIIEANSDALTAILTLTADPDDAPVETDNLAVTMLMSLPGMTEDTAAAILDWLDEDDEPRDPNGCEADYYAGLNTRYAPTNGPILSVEELLLVRGVTPSLLFGADSNRNGVLDPDEQQRYSATVETPGALGWAQYLTIHGGEASKTFAGALRINVNNDDLETLYETLVTQLGDESMASYIVAYRIAGQSTAANAAAAGNNNNAAAQSGGEWSADLLDQLDLSGGGGVKLNQILDLVGSTVTVGQGDQARSYNSPFADNPIAMAVYLPIIMDALTTQEGDFMPGRLNINECPVELLYGLSLLTEEQVQAIMDTREVDSDDPNRRHETWLMTEGIVTLDEMRTLVPLLTCGGDVFRAQIVGYFEKGGAAHRSEYIIDATTVNPKVVFWRDLTHLGRGFDLSVLGLRSAVDAATAQ